LYNSYYWGGYLMCELPELPVTMDGRANLHGDERLEQAMATWEGKPTWRADPDLRDARIVLVGTTTPLSSLLRLDAHFQLVYENPVAVVFVARDDGEYARQ